MSLVGVNMMKYRNSFRFSIIWFLLPLRNSLHILQLMQQREPRDNTGSDASAWVMPHMSGFPLNNVSVLWEKQYENR